MRAISIGIYSYARGLCLKNEIALGKIEAEGFGLRELQQINYPILWGGHPARPMNWAGRMQGRQKR